MDMPHSCFYRMKKSSGRNFQNIETDCEFRREHFSESSSGILILSSLLARTIPNDAGISLSKNIFNVRLARRGHADLPSRPPHSRQADHVPKEPDRVSIRNGAPVS